MSRPHVGTIMFYWFLFARKHLPLWYRTNIASFHVMWLRSPPPQRKEFESAAVCKIQVKDVLTIIAQKIKEAALSQDKRSTVQAAS